MDTPITLKKKTFKEFTFKGIDMKDLMKLSLEEFTQLLNCRLRRKMSRGLKEVEFTAIKKCRDAFAEGKYYSPENPLQTTARECPIVHWMIGQNLAVYNGKDYILFEVKPEMLGNRLKHYSWSRTNTSHGKPGIGASASSKFVPLK